MAAESNGEIVANHSQKLSRIKQRIDFNFGDDHAEIIS